MRFETSTTSVVCNDDTCRSGLRKQAAATTTKLEVENCENENSVNTQAMSITIVSLSSLAFQHLFLQIDWSIVLISCFSQPFHSVLLLISLDFARDKTPFTIFFWMSLIIQYSPKTKNWLPIRWLLQQHPSTMIVLPTPQHYYVRLLLLSRNLDYLDSCLL